MIDQELMDQAGVEALSQELEAEGPAAAITWAVERFPERVAVACSFQDCVIVDLAVQVAPRIEVLFLDTGAHFPETLEFVELVRRRYDLNLTITEPVPEAELWPCGTARCCELRKVQPLAAALAGHRAWITGLKRVDAPTRAATPVLAWDGSRQMFKLNPLAGWTDGDIERYTAEHGLPTHPLLARGYLSIGCAPTTQPVVPGADPRSGRWAGTGKTECGLHV
jgi:phosphoadenosine phosphosulfate reductase